MPLPPAEFVRSPEALQKAYTPEEAREYTRWLATSHYENFHVVSFLLPKRLHQDFYNVYAYCRWADDLGDEIGDRAESLRLLAWWRARTRRHVRRAAPPIPSSSRSAPPSRQYGIPRQPFADLIDAFVQDQTVTRYRDWDELFGYCRNSANPVGRLVLYLCGYSDAQRQRLSDATCTALQLANFWQDVTVDLLKDRVYIPLDVMERHGYTVEELFARRFTPAFREVMREIVEKARELFLEGLPLIGMVNRRLALDLDLFSRGGLRVLDKIEQQDYDVLAARPAISKAERVGLLLGSLARLAFSAGGMMTAIHDSYDYCRRVARTRAKNFYYSFLLLSAQQRKAMCAIYAFMRYCDDLSDEPGATRAAIDRWRAEMEEALEGRFSGPSRLARFPPHRAALRHPAPVLPRDDRRRGLRSGAAPLRDLRRALPLLLPGGLGGGADHHPHLRLRHPQRPAAGRKMRRRVPAHQHPARHPRGRRNAAASTCPSRTCERFGVTEDDLRAGKRTERLPAADAIRSRPRARATTANRAPLLDLIHPRSRSSLVGADLHLLRPAGAHRADPTSTSSPAASACPRWKNPGSSCEPWCRERYPTHGGVRRTRQQHQPRYLHASRSRTRKLRS